MADAIPAATPDEIPDGIYIKRNSSAKRREDGPDRAIAALARGQYGVITLAQLDELGLTRSEIGYRLRVGRLHALHRAVYSVGHRNVTKESRWLAAVLAGGPDAVLSHRSAAELWSLRPGASAPIDVTAPRARRPRTGIAFHRAPLPRDEVTARYGIRVTTIPRTLLDLAAVVRPREVERALNEADVQRLWDRLSLPDLLRRYPTRPGRRTVRAVLEARAAGATLTRSELEERFLALIDGAGLPRPEINAFLAVGGWRFTIDCLWRHERLALELDGEAVHSTIEAFQSDRQRDRILRVAGWRTVRITGRQLHDTPALVEADIRSLIGEAGRSP